MGSFLCPNGTLFNQEYFVCDWWYNVDCNEAISSYGLNARIGVVEE
ncbi:putative Chitin binding Peritrophin-A domain-containing protein 29 [Homarus americanus]|uniref:Putative Chitin binding Peritrophin-A domain-containing protein 29 n=3 Tax=Homarus americanus TaxID=6706 RepID=A0A8J5TVC1_HOMAM|nr:putative Chitin binding Peritrophin-A domain-containing protein 29 [Homarus americanus]